MDIQEFLCKHSKYIIMGMNIYIDTHRTKQNNNIMECMSIHGVTYLHCVV